MKYNWAKQVLELDLEHYDRNFFLFDGEEFFLENLDAAFPRAKGSNSSIFRLVSAANPEITFVIKFCRSTSESRSRRDQLRVERFRREMEALELCVGSDCNDCVVRIEGQGNYRIAQGQTLPFYVMEEAECDLTKFLEDHELSLPQKLALCKRILDSLQELHALGIYHRDIKPDNVLYFAGDWKLSDLGLINYRDRDLELDQPRERIGPFGFYSPEAVNFGLNLRKLEENGYFCRIDEKSDIYQLGLLFWFVFQQEIPSGQVIAADLAGVQTSALFDNVLVRMLQYCKRRRSSMTEIQEQIVPAMHSWGLI